MLRANLDVSVLRYGCIDCLTPGRNAAGEIGNVGKSLARQKLRDPHGPASGMAHHDDLRVGRELGESGRNLAHGHMYDVWNARKLQFPVFANVQDQGIFPAIAPRLELLDRNLAHRGYLELKGLGPFGVLERVDGGFEQRRVVPGSVAHTRDQQGFLRQFVAHHDEQLPTHG